MISSLPDLVVGLAIAGAVSATSVMWSHSKSIHSLEEYAEASALVNQELVDSIHEIQVNNMEYAHWIAMSKVNYAIEQEALYERAREATEAAREVD